MVNKSKSHRQTNLILTLPLACGQRSWGCYVFSSHHLKHELEKKILFWGIGHVMRSPKSMFKEFCSITGAGHLLLQKRHDLICSTLVFLNTTRFSSRVKYLYYENTLQICYTKCNRARGRCSGEGGEHWGCYLLYLGCGLKSFFSTKSQLFLFFFCQVKLCIE